MKIYKYIIVIIFLTANITNAQINNWLKIIKGTKIAIKYFSPSKSSDFSIINSNSIVENGLSLIKNFSDKNVDVTLTFKEYNSHIELFGDVQNLRKGYTCFTLRVIFPTLGLKNISWDYDLDSTIKVTANKKYLYNYVKVKTVIPPAGAFNTGRCNNGGYGDNVGTGGMSFYPLSSITTDKIGLGWGVDMGIPLVFRMGFKSGIGMVSEFDFAIDTLTKKFPNRAFFKILLFEFNPKWNMRAALKKYYEIESKYFKRRITKEGIWLPFAPLHGIKNWKDFGIAFNETDWNSKDYGFPTPEPTIEVDKKASILSFQYTEPWEVEIPISKRDTTYQQVTGKSNISKSTEEYLQTSAALDYNNKLIARKLETPWFSTGWAVSINTNTDPDIRGYNRYDYICDNKIYPALKMNVDGIYFDCLEWNWQYDLNYNYGQFEYTDYPLTFSSSLNKPKPVIWSYSSDYKFMRKIAQEMHEQGKYVMGNTFYWIPFSAGLLDIFGSELDWYSKIDFNMKRLQFLRAMADQKPAVFLLNVGLNDKAFTQAPFDGYKRYFEKMLFYGFFPSFFSEDASNNIYWADSVKYDQGRPFFKKYIPLIKEIAIAGWEPVTFARTNNENTKVERFGNKDSDYIYFTLYNMNANSVETTVTIDAKSLNINEVLSIEEMIDGEKLNYNKNDGYIKVKLSIKENSVCLIKIKKI